MDSQRCLACLPTQIPIIRPINYFFYFYFIYISIINSVFSSKSYLTFLFIDHEIGENNIISVSIFFIISIYERYVSLLSIVLKLLLHISFERTPSFSSVLLTIREIVMLESFISAFKIAYPIGFRIYGYYL